jgi:transketolase
MVDFPQRPNHMPPGETPLLAEQEPGPAAPKVLANRILITAMLMTHHARFGHTGGDLSAADIRAVPYGAVQRDRFILSTGHHAAALYSALAIVDSPSALAHLSGSLSMLNGHPDRDKLPGVEANTGPLSHGPSVALWRQGCAARRGARSS